MKMVSSCWVLLAVVCAIVQGAPQKEAAKGDNPNTRFFNFPGQVNQGLVNPGFGGGFGNPGLVNPGFGNPGLVNPGFQGFPGHVNPVTIPPNTPVNVAGPGGSVVGVPIQQCSFYCRSPITNQYGCCDNAQQSHPGTCPTPRPSCPPVRNFGGPQSCSIDIDCPYPNKCCLDTCLEQRVCKPGLFG